MAVGTASMLLRVLRNDWKILMDTTLGRRPA